MSFVQMKVNGGSSTSAICTPSIQNSTSTGGSSPLASAARETAPAPKTAPLVGDTSTTWGGVPGRKYELNCAAVGAVRLSVSALLAEFVAPSPIPVGTPRK